MAAPVPLKLVILRAVLVLCGLAAGVTILVVSYSSFFGAPPVSHQLIATMPAPGVQLSAVLTRISGDKDAGYLVDVTAPDGESERVANFYAVRKASGAPGLDLAWRDGHTLELHYRRATVARIDQPDLTVAGQHVIVLLKPQN
jgi:hypothetical protein